MRTIRFTRLLVITSIPTLAGLVWATHADPGNKAKKLLADLVVAYEPCTAPNTLTDSGSWAACAPPVRSDPTCGYGPKGKGKLKLTASNTTLTVGLKLTGLDAGCEGEIMGVVFTWRVTGDQCGGGSCTVDETAYTPGYGACTVTGGQCAINAVSDLPALDADRRSGVELIGARVTRAGGAVTTLRMGFLAP